MNERHGDDEMITIATIALTCLTLVLTFANVGGRK